MTREKLEYYRMMYQQGSITKDEMRDIVRTYENQNRSFLELGGRPEPAPKIRADFSPESVQPIKKSRKGKGLASALSEVEKSLQRLEGTKKENSLGIDELMKLLKSGIGQDDA